jgi:predicted ABC-type ATPase
MPDKNLYIIAGCNGAGKTTASFTILPEVLDCR